MQESINKLQSITFLKDTPSALLKGASARTLS
jgi:hypothetical protein